MTAISRNIWVMGCLVYFGYPTAHEDDARRAVRTGLEIIEALRHQVPSPLAGAPPVAPSPLGGVLPAQRGGFFPPSPSQGEEPFYLGPGLQNGIYRRYLSVRPWLRSGTGASVKVWVSICDKPPSGTSFSITDADAPTYQLHGVYDRAEWTVSSTTWGVGALTDLDTRGIGEQDGTCYIVIEIEPNAETRGLALCHLGPRETS